MQKIRGNPVPFYHRCIRLSIWFYGFFQFCGAVSGDAKGTGRLSTIKAADGHPPAASFIIKS
jgi:hypothetical protein